MLEVLVIAGLVAGLIVWSRRKRPAPRGESPESYTRPPSFGPPTPQGRSQEARQQAFDTFGRFGPGGDPRILTDAAEQFQRASDLAEPGDPKKSRDLMHVCILLRTFYDETRELWALNDAAAAGRAALSAKPDPDTYHDVLVRLGICLYAKFQATKENNALTESLNALRAAAKTAAPGRPESLASLYHLAIALYRAYDGSHDPTLLEEAVAAGRQAANNPNPLQVAALCQLVRHLRELSWANKEPALLQEAETVARRGIQITAEDNPADRSSCLLELAQTLDRLAHKTGRLDYLREAVYAADEAVRLTPDPIDRRIRSVIGDGIAKRLRERHPPAESAEEAGERPLGEGYPFSPPPPPPPLRATG